MPFILWSSLEQAGKGIVSGDEEVDVVKVIALGWVHQLSPPLESWSLCAIIMATKEFAVNCVTPKTVK